MKDLIKKLNEANKAYHQLNKEIMSNKEYDELYDELVQLEKETGIIYSNSPTQTVGYEVSKELPKEQHGSKMLSLDKTKSPDELASWLGNKEGILSWKLDGLTIVLTYERGELRKAVTRGNGTVGEVITQNAKVFDNIPLTIPYKEKLIIRGEAIITYSDFEKINSEIEDVDSKYKNPRNLCSGSVRQLDSSIAAGRHIKFIAFQLVSAGDKNFNSVKSSFKWLEELGFQVVENVFIENYKSVKHGINAMQKAIESNDFPSDGLVLTYDDIQYGQSLGTTGKFPKHSMAFKWQDETAETTLLDVEWATSRTGRINPKAIFEPVELEGTTVSNATLNNVSFIEDLELGIGDTITVYKANMIIPTIDKNLTRSGNLEIPKQCPNCGSTTVIKQENESKILFCTNPKCKAKLIKKFTHFVSRDAMNIDGLSEATLTFLIEKDWISTFDDLYNLDERKGEWAGCKGFGNASVNNALAAIEKSKEVLPASFLYSLGIPMIGRSQSAELIKAFDDWDTFIGAVRENYNFSFLEGFGETRNANIHKWYETQYQEDRILALSTIVNFVQAESTETDSTLKEKTFCITGSVEQFKNRKEMQAAIENAGGKVTGSVSSKTDYLVNNDTTSNSSKNKKAKELNIPIITEGQLLSIL